MRSIIINTFITLFFLFTSSTCDIECYELRQNTYYNLDLYVVESTPPYYTNFETVRKLEFQQLHGYPSLAKDLAEEWGNYISTDNNTLITKNGFDFSLINFSGKNQGSSLFQESDIITIEEPNLVIHDFFDLNTNQNTILRLNWSVFEYESIFITELNTINTLDPLSLEEDTLLNIPSQIIGDSIYVEKNNSHISYDQNNDNIYFQLQERFIEYNPGSEKVYNLTPDDKIKRHIMKLNRSNSSELDTILTLPPESSPVSTIKVRQNQLFINISGTYHIYNLDGELEKTLFGIINANLSPSTSSITYNNGKKYYNIDEDYSIDLTQFVSNITYSSSYHDLVLIVENFKKVHFFSVEDKELIRFLSEFSMPQVLENRNKIGKKSLYFPVLTEQKNLRMIFTDQYYIDDQSDNCDI